jgi:ABC-type multidrug transport system permease subunit
MSAMATAVPVALVLWRRSLNEVLRVRGALLPATIAPVIFLLGMTGQFGRLTGLDGFPTDSYMSWIVPLSCLQGAGFAGAATGSNLARDIEQGWFDRLLVAPVPRPVLLAGPILGGITRSLVPATVVLIVGLVLGAELTGGVPGLIALYVACAGFCAVAGLWGTFMALTFRTQQAGPLILDPPISRRDRVAGVSSALELAAAAARWCSGTGGGAWRGGRRGRLGR